jgi:hypothetical protein
VIWLPVSNGKEIEKTLNGVNSLPIPGANANLH